MPTQVSAQRSRLFSLYRWQQWKHRVTIIVSVYHIDTGWAAVKTPPLQSAALIRVFGCLHWFQMVRKLRDPRWLCWENKLPRKPTLCSVDSPANRASLPNSHTFIRINSTWLSACVNVSIWSLQGWRDIGVSHLHRAERSGTTAARSAAPSVPCSGGGFVYYLGHEFHRPLDIRVLRRSVRISFQLGHTVHTESSSLWRRHCAPPPTGNRVKLDTTSNAISGKLLRNKTHVYLLTWRIDTQTPLRCDKCPKHL